jgi:hypothetical protein
MMPPAVVPKRFGTAGGVRSHVFIWERDKMRIGRSLLAVFCASGLIATPWAIAAAADQKPVPKAPGLGTSWVELTVSPKAIERPLMKYRLFPAEYELHDGNAAPILLRLPWERIPYFRETVPKFSDYLDLPLDDVKLRGEDVFIFFPALKRAAYRKTADWQFPIGEEPIGNILIPDVQGARSIVGYGLSVWIRQHLAKGELDRAREGILVGLAVARHYGRTPFVITQLVCAFVDSQLMSRIAELVSQPDSPNLYWALTQLPRPLIDLRPSIELEQQFLPMTVPGLEDLDQIRTEEEWNRRFLAVLRFFRESSGSGQVPTGTESRGLEMIVKRARTELAAWTEGGAKRIAEMSDGEAGLRWLLHVYDDQSHETTALNSLDPPQAFPRLIALQKRLTEFQKALDAPKANLFVNTLGFYVRCHKIERQIDALRIVEALRHYAAGHDSQLPESLDKMTDTPIPDDPFTGKPFHYTLRDGVAVLSGEAIPVVDPDRELAGIRYRIKIRK